MSEEKSNLHKYDDLDRCDLEDYANKLEQKNKQLKEHLKQRDEVINEVITYLENYYIGNLRYAKESQIAFRKLLYILYEYKGDIDYRKIRKWNINWTRK